MILLNRGYSRPTATARWNDIGLNSSTVVDARDLRAVNKLQVFISLGNFDLSDVSQANVSRLSDVLPHSTRHSVRNQIKATLVSHACKMYVLTPQ